MFPGVGEDVFPGVGDDVFPGVGATLLFAECAVAEAWWDGGAGFVVIRATAVPIASGLASGKASAPADTEGSIRCSGAEIAALEVVSHPKTARTTASAIARPIHSRCLKRLDSTGHSPTIERAQRATGDG